jgi:uncharacterized protein (DUF697 family)
MTHMETLRRVLDGDYTNASPEEKAAAISDVIQVAAAASAAAAFQPIPLLDIALITPIQILMVQAIGRVHGQKLDQKSVLEILSTIGASLVSQGVIMTAAKFVPVLGWAVAMSMAYALSWAIGRVSDHYFATGRGSSPAELRAMFDRLYKEKKAEKEAQHAGNQSLKQRLEQLKEALANGLITQEEFDRKKEEMLRSF